MARETRRETMGCHGILSRLDRTGVIVMLFACWIRSRQRRVHLRGLEALERRQLLATVSGELPVGVQVWMAAEGPYHVVGDLTVPADSTLRIEPGTQVFIDEGVEINVRGRLIAQGDADRRILFSAPPTAPFVPDRPNGVNGLPDGPPRWKGIHFRGSRHDENLLAYVDVLFAQSGDGSIGAIDSNAVIDNVTIAGTHLRMVYGNNASLIVQNSTFPNMFGPDEHPAALGLDNVSEHVKIVGLPPANGQLIIRNNHFGTNKGHNDVIDGDSGLRPGPILQIIDNVFAGVGDEFLDLGGDVFVEGNLFRHVTKDPDNRDARFSNAISTGDGPASSTVMVSRNIFYDVDHAMHLRGGNAAIFENNTIVQVHPPGTGLGGALTLYADVAGERPGRGAYFAGNVFADVPAIFNNVDRPIGHESQLRMDHNLFSAQVASQPIGDRPLTPLDLGVENVVGEPLFVDASVADFRLTDNSPARGTGPLGIDLGAFVSKDLHVIGVPVGATSRNGVTLTVGGPGLFGFRYRIDGGDWSDERPIGSGFAGEMTERTADLILDNLSSGDHQVELMGRDFAGNWQVNPTVTTVWHVTATVGDVNLDAKLDASDINDLCLAVQTDSRSPRYDLTQDELVDDADVRSLVYDELHTTIGDVTLDGHFNSSDLIAVFQSGEFEDLLAGNSLWTEGDWNCDGEFTTTDLVVAFQEGSYS